MPWRVFSRRDRAVSALEFVLVMPVLLVIMVGIADFGNALQQSIRLEAAARAGAQVAFTRPVDTVTNQNDPNVALIRTAVLNKLPGWPQAANCSGASANGVCVAIQGWCQCPAGNDIRPTLGFDCSADNPPCDDFNRYTSISVTRNYEPLIFVPTQVLRGNVEIRIR